MALGAQQVAGVRGQQARLAVAMAATLAGNFTLLGSVANLIVVLWLGRG